MTIPDGREPAIVSAVATDLVVGQPMGHALRTCRQPVTVARELGLDAGTIAEVHYGAMLR